MRCRAVMPTAPTNSPELRNPSLLRKVLTDARYERGGQLLEGVVAMLTKMV